MNMNNDKDFIKRVVKHLNNKDIIICPSCIKKTLGNFGQHFQVGKTPNISSAVFTWKCPCGHEETRPSRKRDRDVLRKNERKWKDPKRNVHVVWHMFRRKFMKDNEYLFTGIELIKQIDNWMSSLKIKDKSAYRRIHSIKLHNGSLLLTVEHRSLYGDFMGSSMVYIPMEKEKPTQLFLYPPSAHEIEKSLTKFCKKVYDPKIPLPKNYKPTSKDSHTWEMFIKKFKKDGYYQDNDYFLMRKIDKWMDKIDKKHQKNIDYITVDDSYFSTSAFLIINTLYPNGFCSGCHIVFVPQCDGNDPIDFDLHIIDMKKLLLTMKKVNKFKNKNFK